MPPMSFGPSTSRCCARPSRTTAGTVVKVMGDGLMAVFDGAAAGVAAGVALQQAVRRQAQRTALPIQIRVGLAAGDVTWDADDYHGTPVVEAARLEPKAAPGTILASELVRMLAGSRTDVEFTSAGPFELKGLPGPVNAYEVGWPSEPASGRPLPSALEASDEMPFTGRDEERRQLGELWRASESGGFRLAIVSGEAGIGKTRLASELARGVDDGATVLAGRCDDELDVPCQPFVEALRHFLHHCPPAYLRDELGTEARELVRLAPELADRFPDLVPAPATDAETARVPDVRGGGGLVGGGVRAGADPPGRRRPAVGIEDHPPAGAAPGPFQCTHAGAPARHVAGQ